MISIREAIAKRIGAVTYDIVHEDSMKDKIEARIKASNVYNERKENAYIDKLAKAIARELAIVLKEGSE